MRFGRIGGILIVGGCVLFVVAGGIVAGGGAVGIGARGVGGLVPAASMALVGFGAALLCLAGPGPLHGRIARIGLRILAVGLVSLLASSIMAGASEFDPLESLPILALLFVGLLATFLGSLVTALSLVRAPGPSRAVGSLFFAGMLLLVLATILGGNTGPLAALGYLGVLLSGIGIGVLAIKGDRSAPVVPA